MIGRPSKCLAFLMLERAASRVAKGLFWLLLPLSPISAMAGDKASKTAEPASSHWAFVPPKRLDPPAVMSPSWVRNPIDAFVLAELEENGLKPSPEADRATLLRRASFDLTGLPPSPVAVEEFLADTSPQAYERAVERLLSSPRHGERWAQHWLDLARYADSDGFEFDQTREEAWRYRDWVVGALNRDMPYDEFVRQQLAGDEVHPDDSSAFIATGFNRCYPDMVDLNDQGLRRQNALNDMTETTGLAFLGLTIGCARCHDHKTDPIRQADFYQLVSFFSPARFRDDYPVASPAQRALHERRVQSWTTEFASLQRTLMRLEGPLRRGITPEIPKGLTDDVVSAFQKADADRSLAEVGLVYEALQRDRRIPPQAWGLLLDPTSFRLRQILLKSIAQHVSSAPAHLPTARGIEEEAGVPAPTFLLRRGEFSSKGPEVTPQFPGALLPAKGDTQPRIVRSLKSSGRRSALAEWLVSAEHPLTSRVIVNRLWQHHFGRGIVATPSDFGVMGAEPTHPSLLDWLARELVHQQWSLKSIHRLIVTSATYRQSSASNADALAIDPENQYLWRYQRQRLDGEAIRDAILFVSGQINGDMGGPPVFPKLPAELTKLSSKGAVWPVSADLRQRDRRSLYVFVRRNLRYPFFEAFDRPDTNASCPRRAVTTIAPQALSLMNSEFATDSARALAERVEREVPSDRDSRIRRTYLLAFGRQPDDAEIRLAHEFLDHDLSWSRFCLAIINTNEFIYVD